MAVSPSRRVAFDVLRKVARGGNASDLLRIRSEKLDSRDAALASELVFGVLRYQAQLDFLIRHYSGRDTAGLDVEVLIALRMGIYQMRYLERIPRHAAVTESVDLVKRAHKRSAAGFVNAVLRKVDDVAVMWPSWEIALSCPAWLLENWKRMFGREGAERIARAFLRKPETYVWVPESRRRELRNYDVEATEVPECYRVVSGSVDGLQRQDISSQTIVPLLELEPGQRLLDVCAAPGNKTAQAVERGAQAVAVDISFDRLAAMSVPGAERVVANGSRPLPLRTEFDRVLVDAPCSGTGTLGRNPEIKWRLQPADLERHHARQVALLENALDRLAPGGQLVYSTCSLEYEENEQVVEEVLSRRPPEFVLAHQVRRIPGVDPGDGFYAAVIVRLREPYPEERIRDAEEPRR